MPGALTEHLDAVQLITAAFFVFFAGLIYYLRREDKREGYPLWDVSPQGVPIEGFPPVPPTKVYLLQEGGTTTMPHRSEPSAMRAAPVHRHLGAPLVPIGDPMLAEVGPGAYPMRNDRPMLSEGTPQVQPMRIAAGWNVAKGDADPRGMRVFDAGRVAVGTVTDIWVDRGVKLIRYLEVKLDGDDAAAPILVPIFRTEIRGKRRAILIKAMLAGHVRTAPRLQSPDQITAREEDRVNAYFSAAYMYGRGHSSGAAPNANLPPRFPG